MTRSRSRPPPPPRRGRRSRRSAPRRSGPRRQRRRGAGRHALRGLPGATTATSSRSPAARPRRRCRSSPSASPLRASRPALELDRRNRRLRHARARSPSSSRRRPERSSSPTRSARGLMADMHVAVRRDGVWLGQDILSNRGLYLSINPKVVVTRQQYVDFDDDGAPVTKTRSIFSLVWWEESGPVAGPLRPDLRRGRRRSGSTPSQAWNLNELAGRRRARPTRAACRSRPSPTRRSRPTRRRTAASS